MKSTMSLQDIREEVARLRKAGKLTRAKAIRLHCIDCAGGTPYAVGKCENTTCPLWEFRQSKLSHLQEDE